MGDELSPEPISELTEWSGLIEIEPDGFRYNPFRYWGEVYQRDSKQIESFLNEVYGIDDFQNLLKELKERGETVTVFTRDALDSDFMDPFGRVHVNVTGQDAYFHDFQTDEVRVIPWQRKFLHEFYHAVDFKSDPDAFSSRDKDYDKRILAEEGAVDFVDVVSKKLPDAQLGLRLVYCNGNTDIDKLQIELMGVSELIADKPDRMQRARDRIENLSQEDREALNKFEGGTKEERQQLLHDTLNSCSY